MSKGEMETEQQKRPGYKWTKLGWVPEEWEVGKINDLIESFTSGVSVNSEDRTIKNGEVGVLKVSAVSYERFRPDEHKVILEKEISRAKISPKAGTILISRANTFDLVGTSVLIEKDYPNLFLSDKIWQTNFFSNRQTNSAWLNFLLQSDKLRLLIGELATGTSGSMKNITQSDFLNLPIPIPPLPEQQKIAAILSTWDKAIELTQQLIAAKEEQKKGLMQQLLTGKVRLKGFEGEWEQVKFGDVTKLFSRRNKKLVKARIYSVTNDRGFVYQNEQFGRELAGDDLSSYKIIKKHEFAYNPARINVGSIAYFKEEIGIISSLYVCFSTNNRIEDDFLYYLLDLDKTKHALARFGEGGVRVYLWYPLFSSIKISIPKIEEQGELIKLFAATDNELRLLIKKIEVLKEQKKGLMQQLLTGKTRVTHLIQSK